MKLHLQSRRYSTVIFMLVYFPSCSLGFGRSSVSNPTNDLLSKAVRLSMGQEGVGASALFYQKGDHNAVNIPFSTSTSTIKGPRIKYVNNGINNRYSAGDWLHNVSTLPQSSVLRDVRNPVIVIAAWSQAVAVMHRILLSQTESLTCQKIATDMCIGSLPHSLLVSSLGLLLVFRTNSAYQRFAEGRKIWEQILSVSRNFSRMVNLYEIEVGFPRKNRIQKLLASFPYLLRHHIRPRCLSCEDATNASENIIRLEERPQPLESRFEEDLRCKSASKGFDHCWVDRRSVPWSLLPKGTLGPCTKAMNRPLWVCDRIAKEVSKIPYCQNFTSRERLSLLSSIDKLSNAIGECERIHQTAVPLNYARHSLRSLTLWLFSLPFVMVKDLGLLTGLVMGAISWLLFGVYQIGYSIEDPFQGSLRLTELCDAIKADVIGDEIIRDTAFHLRNEDDNVKVPSSVELEPALVQLAHNFALNEEINGKLQDARSTNQIRNDTSSIFSLP